MAVVVITSTVVKSSHEDSHGVKLFRNINGITTEIARYGYDAQWSSNIATDLPNDVKVPTEIHLNRFEITYAISSSTETFVGLPQLLQGRNLVSLLPAELNEPCNNRISKLLKILEQW